MQEGLNSKANLCRQIRVENTNHVTKKKIQVANNNCKKISKSKIKQNLNQKEKRIKRKSN